LAAKKTIGDGVLIAVDWGTSRLRAWLVDSAGEAIADADSGDGIGRIEGGHEAIFERAVAAWPRLPAIMAGMIGSRQGWREAPYVPCPATTSSIAGGIIRFGTDGGRAIAIVPGLAVRSGDGDVLRGEETQIAGLIAGAPTFTGTVILPGTHSKWVRVESGTIADFQTYMTGELFELLSQKSFLRHSVADTGSDLSTSPEFALAVRRTAVEGLPFVAGLFPVRARQLLADVKLADNLAYLSGLVIGGEIAAARATGRLDGGGDIRIVGARSLARAYMKALEVAGFTAKTLDGDRLVLAGLADLARSIGFLPEKAG
jgi:2-dehydro-3-deoxygalactonokinase